jgi:hypothetical protein
MLPVSVASACRTLGCKPKSPASFAHILQNDAVRGVRCIRAFRCFLSDIGVPEYHVTALVWVQGMLEHDYNVHPSEVKWYWGGVDAPNSQGARVTIQLPENISLEAIAPNQSLNQMLVDGELDAIISPRAPLGFTEGTGKLVRLFEDYTSEEKGIIRKQEFS